MNRKYIGLYVEYLLFVSDLNEICIISADLKNTPKHKISWKSIYWKLSCSMRTDGEIDRRTGRYDEANNRFSQFCERA
jgi:hypothetical protein